MIAPLIIFIAALVVFLTARLICQEAIRTRVLPDRPNHRSSHERATSRAGGIGIFAGWFAGMIIIAAFTGDYDTAVTSAAFTGIALLAFVVGLADDIWSLTPFWKFSGQSAVAALFCLVIGPLALIPTPFAGLLEIGPFGVVLTILWIVGFMNAYNFMDGVNGIAAGSALAGLIVFAVIAAFSGAPVAAVIAILLALSCFGFLPSNLIKGRLFMGDGGSQLIGFLIPALGVYAANISNGQVSIFVMPVIFLPFLIDVAWTLTHRLVRGQNILTGHREHIYQLLLRRGYSHTEVAVAYMSMVMTAGACAILMLALPPGRQWFFPLALSAVFLGGAVMIYRGAERRGFLAPNSGKATSAGQDTRETDVATRSARAAE